MIMKFMVVMNCLTHINTKLIKEFSEILKTKILINPWRIEI